jgi:RND family efflux transporter MFP subunit
VNSDNENDPTSPPSGSGARASAEPAGDRGLLRLGGRLLPPAIFLACVFVAWVLLRTGPVVERKPRPREARLVETTEVHRADHRTRVGAMGTVVPSRQVAIQPQVSGRIVEVSPEFLPGGHFAAGEVLVRIEAKDYELAVRRREGALAEARAQLHIEEGNQSIARLEFELLGEAVTDDDRSLVLRGPQLETVRARVAVAEADLAQARLDLERTDVRAPFAALVRTRGVELGSRVDPATTLATLVATDAYWVAVAVPVRHLRWIEIPRTADETGSTVRILNAASWPPGAFREGRVVRLLGDLESEGRMARLLVRVDDPLALEPEHREAPRLLLDSFVSVEILGREILDVVELDRDLLRDGDRVWVMGADDTLEIRDVDVLFRDEESVLVRAGLSGGERLVTSDLSSPVAGMLLRVAEPGDAGAAPAGEAVRAD